MRRNKKAASGYLSGGSEAPTSAAADDGEEWPDLRALLAVEEESRAEE